MHCLPLAALLSTTALAATLQVGPGKTYARPCAAFAAAAAGDTVEIDAAGNGTYDGDVCGVSVSNLTIRGVNGRAHIDAAGQNAQGKGLWVLSGNDVTVEDIELSGASVVDLNGAGIRAEGTNLTLRRCFFHDNQEGLLGGAGVVLIEASEFARNGNCLNAAGCAHNLYLSANVTRFTLQYSYSHDVPDGHLVKSRAQVNFILYNRLTGEAGTDSYELDLPQGGTSYVIGNLIQQGTSTGNSTLLAYAEEGATNAGQDLYVINNTFVNDRGTGTFVNAASSPTPAVIKNNVFIGGGTITNQASAVLAANYSGSGAWLVSQASYDYHLQAGSPCVNAGVDAGTSPGGVSLTPAFEYVHPAGVEARASVGVIDVGAYELGGAGGGGAGGGGASGGTDLDGGVACGFGGGSSACPAQPCGCTQFSPTLGLASLAGALAALRRARRRSSAPPPA